MKIMEDEEAEQQNLMGMGGLEDLNAQEGQFDDDCYDDESSGHYKVGA